MVLSLGSLAGTGRRWPGPRGPRVDQREEENSAEITSSARHLAHESHSFTCDTSLYAFLCTAHTRVLLFTAVGQFLLLISGLRLSKLSVMINTVQIKSIFSHFISHLSYLLFFFFPYFFCLTLALVFVKGIVCFPALLASGEASPTRRSVRSRPGFAAHVAPAPHTAAVGRPLTRMRSGSVTAPQQAATVPVSAVQGLPRKCNHFVKQSFIYSHVASGLLIPFHCGSKLPSSLIFLLKGFLSHFCGARVAVKNLLSICLSGKG